MIINIPASGQNTCLSGIARIAMAIARSVGHGSPAKILIVLMNIGNFCGIPAVRYRRLPPTFLVHLLEHHQLEVL